MVSTIYNIGWNFVMWRHPFSSIHGGGPPLLMWLDITTWTRYYKIIWHNRAAIHMSLDATPGICQGERLFTHGAHVALGIEPVINLAASRQTLRVTVLREERL